MAEGIFKSLKGVTLSRADRFAPFQSIEAVYHDDWADYSTNEPTMDGTASAVLLMALMAADQPADCATIGRAAPRALIRPGSPKASGFGLQEKPLPEP